MAEPRFELYLAPSGSASEPDVAKAARAAFAEAVLRIATESTIGDDIKAGTELELLEAATAITTGRR